MPDERSLRAVPDPIAATHRVSGVHWWDPDREAHLADLPKHCPSCGHFLDLENGLAVEYWEAERRVYHTWCKSCSWAGDISKVHRMIGHEAEHD